MSLREVTSSIISLREEALTGNSPIIHLVDGQEFTKLAGESKSNDCGGVFSNHEAYINLGNPLLKSRLLLDSTIDHELVELGWIEDSEHTLEEAAAGTPQISVHSTNAAIAGEMAANLQAILNYLIRDPRAAFSAFLAPQKKEGNEALITRGTIFERLVNQAIDESIISSTWQNFCLFLHPLWNPQV